MESIHKNKYALITGVSSSIGEALAKMFLSNGFIVCGIARRIPGSWIKHTNMHFFQLDITDFDEIKKIFLKFKNIIHGMEFKYLFLNAGMFGPSPKGCTDISVLELMDVYKLNVVSVKATIDTCIKLGMIPEYTVASASISGLRPRAGMLAYASSKAALNSLIKIYQLENNNMKFIALGLCNVFTSIKDAIDKYHDEPYRFPELHSLSQRAKKPGYVVSPEQRAIDIKKILDNIELLNLNFGEFYDIRDLMLALKEKINQR
ncbi:SDR family NAD(P)-dependent oxidoreductase [Xenorhabdus sp. SF857]|uniref:SDR family oxidoreductase n=1 Tax=Xenorhabdus bakwenae TaxID=3026967 RepID=UPI002557F506|nr:SDR family oxidoreductase [Xenorhabdus sp. SF857]WFQ79796.1 SDR family NAD(P)-dependent oxidoreductase [Xenorhabdus sp. SF857]